LEALEIQIRIFGIPNFLDWLLKERTASYLLHAYFKFQHVGHVDFKVTLLPFRAGS